MAATHPIRSRNPLVRTVLTVLGVVLVIISPLVGAIPGPGGIFVFAAGLALMLQNAHWAKRAYARTKRRWPRLGNYADLGLRRASALRRWERAKAAAPMADTSPSRLKAALAICRDFVLGRAG